MKYPPNIRLIRLMCSSRVDPLFVLRTFLRGVDGVFIGGGCHPGECRYITGNLYARRWYSMTKKLLETAGIDPKGDFEWNGFLPLRV